MTLEDEDQDRKEDAFPCPECGQPLRLRWTIPRFRRLQAINTFICTGCNRLFTNEDDPSGPLSLIQ
jgi:hypothetical protein